MVNDFCGRPQVKAVAWVGSSKTAQTFCTRAMASLLAQKAQAQLAAEAAHPAGQMHQGGAGIA